MAMFFNSAREVAGLTTVPEPQADVIVSLGMWGTARALAEAHPKQAVVANSALIYGYHDRSGALAWEGWSFPDTISETNAVYRALGDGSRHSGTGDASGRSLDDAPNLAPNVEPSVGSGVGPGVAGQFDLGRLIGEGIARSTTMTGVGLMEGLERVKCIPSATGEAGTTMGFGRCDRGALKGKYLVIRKWETGVSRSWQ